ncbi:MAG: hypothetical protein AB7E47_08100 [Desulfovibrionaceae bacterium]
MTTTLTPKPHRTTREMRDLHRSEEVAHRIQLTEVDFSPGARATIGLAVRHIAEQYLLEPSDLARRMQGEIYWIEPSDKLMIVLPVPEADADMFVEVPAGHWRFKDRDSHTQ